MISTSVENDRAVTYARMDRLFHEMGRICESRGLHLEIAVYGGSALMMDFSYRLASHDIDFHPVRGGGERIRSIAREAAGRLGLEDFMHDAMRDDVSIFVSERAEHLPHGDYGGERGTFRVLKASPRYILAMKVMAMRSSLETQDMLDVWQLVDACKISSAKEALDLVGKFYPDQVIPKRNVLLLEDIFDEKRAGRPYSAAIGW